MNRPNARNLIWSVLSHEGLPFYEIVVSLIILSFLWVMHIGAAFRTGEKTLVATNRQNMLRLNMTLQTYRWANDVFPSELGALICAGKEQGACIPVGTSDQLVDVWGTPYIYGTDGKGFTITTLGADKSPGGKGSNADVTMEGP